MQRFYRESRRLCLGSIERHFDRIGRFREAVSVHQERVAGMEKSFFAAANTESRLGARASADDNFQRHV
jgi:hypothetical protein